MKKDKIPKKRGPAPKYKTEEEKLEARRVSAKKYYESHKEICIQKQLDRNKKNIDILRRYREGEIIDAELKS